MCVEWVSESAWNPQDRLVFCIVSLVLDLQRVHPTHTFVEGVYTFRTSAKSVKLPGMITLPYLTLPCLGRRLLGQWLAGRGVQIGFVKKGLPFIGECHRRLRRVQVAADQRAVAREDRPGQAVLLPRSEESLEL